MMKQNVVAGLQVYLDAFYPTLRVAPFMAVLAKNNNLL